MNDVLVHTLDEMRVLPVNDVAFEFHRWGKFFVFRVQQLVDQTKLLDGLHTRKLGVDPLNFLPDEVLYGLRTTQAHVVGKWYVIVLSIVGDVFLIDHHEAGEVGTSVAHDDRIGYVW